MPWVEYTDPNEKILEAEDLELERRTRRKKSTVFLSHAWGFKTTESRGTRVPGSGARTAWEDKRDASISGSLRTLPYIQPVTQPVSSRSHRHSSLFV